ncbi:hypothetical protein FCV25MIE_12814 [Fagus crenata]
MVSEHGPWSDEEHVVFVGLQVPDELKEETYLAVLLSCWLCAFVFPIKDLHNIRHRTYKVASLMASGRVFGLAASVLASIYRFLTKISKSPVSRKTDDGFAIHYVYAWISHIFKTHLVVNSKLAKPLMVKYFGVSSAAVFDELSAHERVRSSKNFFWHGTAFKTKYDQTFIDNEVPIDSIGILDFIKIFQVTHGHEEWWQKVCGDDFTKGTELLAKIAFGLVKRPMKSKPRKGQKEQSIQNASHTHLKSLIVMPPLENDCKSKDSSKTNMTNQHPSEKHSNNIQLNVAIEVLDEDTHNNSDLSSHAPTPINSESSICRPSIENLTVKRRKINDFTLPPKFVSGDDEVSSRHSPLVGVPEVSMFYATMTISSVHKKEALMLGEILLLKLSELPLNKTPSKAEIDQIYREIESFGVESQLLGERVDKYSKDVMDYLEMKASMSKQMSLNSRTCRVEEIELLRSGKVTLP